MKKQLMGTLFGILKMPVEHSGWASTDILEPTWAEEWNELFHCVAKCIAAEGSLKKMEYFFVWVVHSVTNSWKLLVYPW